METIIMVAAFIIFVLILSFILLFKSGFSGFESAQKKAGRRGEAIATQVIKEVLNEQDVLLTNVKLSIKADGETKQTELDNVVVNNRGVFIIEVKNYSGELCGEEDDFEWIKTKVTDAGNMYQKKVRNPIVQMKRQVYILSRYLKKNGIDVWIEGYVFFVEQNSPVNSECVLWDQKDINRVVHRGYNNNLSNKAVNKIIDLLE